jgi:hypothetical protein
MKILNPKARCLIMILTLIFSMACALTQIKTAPITESVLPPAPTVPSITPLTLPTVIPSEVPSPAVIIHTSTPTADQIIPEDSKALYQELASDLNQFEVKIAQQPKSKSKTATIAVELAFANGNAGEALLSPKVMEYNKVLLDRLQAMGVRGVVLGIKYPLLKKGFPNAERYLKFYQDITNLCHQHHMKVLVEAGAIFSGTPYSSVKVDWSTETTDSFLQGLQDQLVLISTSIKPDYLTLANEPTTEEALTHLDIPPDVWQNFLETTLKKVDQRSGTLYGAGTGTWEKPEYIKAAFNVSGLDYIDLHIYPFNKDGIFLDRAVNYANQARAAGKKVVISECWLFKAASTEMSANVLGNMEMVQNRDVFSFWTPLDARYMKDIITLSDSTPIDFASFFWTRNLFYNITYGSDTSSLKTQQVNQIMNQGAIKAVSSGALSNLGQAFQQLLSDPARK